MNQRGAARAFAELLTDGDAGRAGAIAEWLAGREGVGDRFTAEDLEAAVIGKATAAGQGAEPAAEIAALLSELQAALPVLLLAGFDGARISTSFAFPPIWLGPARQMNAQHGLSALFDHQPAFLSEDTLLVAIEEVASGALGATRGFRQLRAVLGAIYLLASEAGQDGRLGVLPEGTPAPVYIGPSDSGRFARVFHHARIAGKGGIEIDGLLKQASGQEVFAECTGSGPEDLVTERLAQFAPWLQVGFDAVAYPDAVLALGISLEALVGGEQTEAVVEVVSRRCGYLLGEGETDEEVALNRLDWVKRVRRHYDRRSSVAHGRYIELPENSKRERDGRREFERLVCSVAMKLREIGHREQWLSYSDMKRWWDLVQMA